MSQKKWNETLTGRFGLLGILLGLGFIGSQIPEILLNYGGLDNNRAFVFSIIIMGIGVMISVISYVTLMSSRYKTSCIIPPEWKNILKNEDESPTTKIIIFLYMIQWIFLIPVVVYSMALYSIEWGRQPPLEVFIIIFLYLFLLFCGYVIFSHFYKTRKVGDS